jgi:hypothetical protein
MFLGPNSRPGGDMRFHRCRGPPGGRPGERQEAFRGHFTEASGFPLGIKTYYILCSSAKSTPIIVAWEIGRKRFLMFIGGFSKPSPNQSSIGKK